MQYGTTMSYMIHCYLKQKMIISLIITAKYGIIDTWHTFVVILDQMYNKNNINDINNTEVMITATIMI